MHVLGITQNQENGIYDPWLPKDFPRIQVTAEKKGTRDRDWGREKFSWMVLTENLEKQKAWTNSHNVTRTLGKKVIFLNAYHLGSGKRE